MNPLTASEFKQELRRLGFKEWHTNNPISFQHAESRWQHRIYCGVETLYFINAYVYNTSTIDPRCKDDVEFEATFDCKELQDEWITVQLHGCKSIESAITFFQRAYEQLNCEPDRYNN